MSETRRIECRAIEMSNIKEDRQGGWVRVIIISTIDEGDIYLSLHSYNKDYLKIEELKS